MSLQVNATITKKGGFAVVAVAYVAQVDEFFTGILKVLLCS